MKDGVEGGEAEAGGSDGSDESSEGGRKKKGAAAEELPPSSWSDGGKLVGTVYGGFERSR